MHVTRRALHRGQAVERLAERRAQLVDVDIRLRQQVTHRAALLVEQRHHQVRRFDELMVAPDRQALGVGQGHLEFAGQSIHPHGKNSDKT